MNLPVAQNSAGICSLAGSLDYKMEAGNTLWHLKEVKKRSKNVITCHRVQKCLALHSLPCFL